MITETQKKDAKNLWNRTSGCAKKTRIPTDVRRDAEREFPELVGLRGKEWLTTLWSIAYAR